LKKTDKKKAAGGREERGLSKRYLKRAHLIGPGEGGETGDNDRRATGRVKMRKKEKERKKV